MDSQRLLQPDADLFHAVHRGAVGCQQTVFEPSLPKSKQEFLASTDDMDGNISVGITAGDQAGSLMVRQQQSSGHRRAGSAVPS